MNPFNRTFEQTFPCGTSIRPCKDRFGNGITPVTFTNFVNNTDGIRNGDNTRKKPNATT